MKKKVIMVILILLVLSLGGGFFLLNSIASHPLKNDTQAIEVTVNQGDTFYSVLSRLSTEGKIKNISIIKAYLKLKSIDTSIKPGKYEVKANLSLKEFIAALGEGDPTENTVTVTVPEGYDIEQIAEKLESAGLFSKEEFLNAVKSYNAPSHINKSEVKKYNLEGYLFPDTYSLSLDSTAEQVIDKMLERFEAILLECQQELNITLSEDNIEKIVTIASMIEKEAKTKEEMPRISSVIYNRNNQNYPLQIDATVLYALGYHKEVVTYEDLKIDSPYNTYKVSTLPAGPIASAGKEALKAAMAPDTTDYFYYLYDSSKGEHYFTNDYNDFLQKKKEFGY